MKQTLRLGRVAGIPVGVHWSVLVIMVLLAQGLAMAFLPERAPGSAARVYWTVAVAAAVLFLASLLAHELAHALVARHYRMRVERVTLWLLGGVAELGGLPPTARADLRVAAVGPLTSLAVSAGFFAATAAGNGFLPQVCVAALSWLALVNVLLAGFNLLPAAPLDGGRILRAMLWRRWDDQVRAQVAAARAGRVLGGGLIALGAAEILVTGDLAGIWLALVGWFLATAAGAEARTAGLTDRLAGLPVWAAMNPRPVVASAEASVQAFLTTVACRSRQRRFPVVDHSGRPIGMVTLSDLARIPPPLRPVTAVGGMAVAGATVEVDRPLADIAPLLAAGAGPILVVDGGVLVGVLDQSDLARVLDLAGLGLPSPPQRADQSPPERASAASSGHDHLVEDR
ncbi:MAG TPA: site-2 protease family protein [Micromonosporaceae bacterium]|nr:site-2 protease family protein [Micromonosporaceae bacterium]